MFKASIIPVHLGPAVGIAAPMEVSTDIRVGVVGSLWGVEPSRVNGKEQRTVLDLLFFVPIDRLGWVRLIENFSNVT